MGFLITFEGPEGGGKTTLASDLKEYFIEKGIDALFVREPGGTAIGEQIRSILKDCKNRDMDCMTEALLFQAARSQICRSVISPALKDNRIVVLDRFRDSSVVYQGVARGLGKEMIEKLNDISTGGLLPDLTLLLDLNPEVGISRIKNAADDRFDSEEIAFHKKVRDAYLGLMNEDSSGRWVKIDADRPRDKVRDDVFKIVEEKLKSAGLIEGARLGKERF